jgi:hypothetical protein
MILTAATTVVTVKYLSLSELEKYKKQFQGFWVPFMEQFIPATTVWVAGERWCNDPCPIISPCDYDFEYVEGDVSVIDLPRAEPPLKPNLEGQVKGYTTTTQPTNTVLANPIGQASSGSNTTDSPQIVQTTDLGITTSTPIFKTQAETNIDILAYRNRFTETEIQTV